MTVKLLCDYGQYKAGNLVTLTTAEETALVAQHLADTNTTGGTTYVAPIDETGNGWVPLKVNKTLAPWDDGKAYAATVAVTVTLPLGLKPRPTVVILPPPSGVVTLVGVAPVNGSAQTLTRSRSSNPNGFLITPHPEEDGYAVNGS